MKILLDIFIIIILFFTGFYFYTQYWDSIKYAFFGPEVQYTIYLGSKALNVTIADEPEERIQGLSGVTSLTDFNGKLFIFDTDEKHGIWMKDMLFPIDIIWIDKNLMVIDIAENVDPSTYPRVYAPKNSARFALEVNAFFVSTTKIAIGDRLVLPPGILPKDIEKSLQ
jgi:uncharacterized membrane protein (UPF0127 family)